MNLSPLSFLSFMLPTIESEVLPAIEAEGLAKWNSAFLPLCQNFAKSLPLGKGQEEATILVSALDQIVKFEASRKI